MIKNKRGQGLSLTTIVIAALALIVLVVLIMIFTGRMSIFGGDVSDVTKAKSCEDSCFPSGDFLVQGHTRVGYSCPTNERQGIGNFNLAEGQICCYSTNALDHDLKCKPKETP